MREDAVIDASSVFTRNVPSITLVTGSPAKVIARVSVPMTFSTSYEKFNSRFPLFRTQP